MESELFGYTSGSFTGAVKGGKSGKFEQADGGTIFLDEIGEMPLFMQSKLLRVLQSGEIQKIGSQVVQKADVRVIAATNRDLKQRSEKVNSAMNLYFRLNTFKITIPPLRERGEDVLLLADFFLEKYARKYGKKVTISPEVKQYFLTFPWNGKFVNYRVYGICCQLFAIVRIIKLEHLPDDLLQHDNQVSTTSYFDADEFEAGCDYSLKSGLQMMEKKRIQQAISEANGNKTKAMKPWGLAGGLSTRSGNNMGLMKKNKVYTM